MGDIPAEGQGDTPAEGPGDIPAEGLGDIPAEGAEDIPAEDNLVEVVGSLEEEEHNHRQEAEDTDQQDNLKIIN